MTKQKGFTLIELLVVIVIIGILATLATVTLSSARQKARDARRVSDVKQVQTALELYYNDAGAYPSVLTAASPIAYGTTTYMAKMPNNATPVDLTATCLSTMTTYPYYYDSATSYHIVYCLGGTTGSITAGSHQASPGSIQDP